VTSPTAITFDEKGALYVAETNRFRFGIHDDRASTAIGISTISRRRRLMTDASFTRNGRLKYRSPL
jgi:hypothetical protein